MTTIPIDIPHATTSQPSFTSTGSSRSTPTFPSNLDTLPLSQGLGLQSAPPLTIHQLTSLIHEDVYRKQQETHDILVLRTRLTGLALASRLYTALPQAMETLLECFKNEQKAEFEKTYNCYMDVFPQIVEKTLFNPYPKPGFLEFLSWTSQHTILDFLAIIRNQPEFLVEPFRSRSEADLEQYLAPTSSSNILPTPAPLHRMLLTNFFNPLSGWQREQVLTLQLYSKIVATLLMNSRPEKFILDTLDAYVSTFWGLDAMKETRYRFELALEKVLRRGEATLMNPPDPMSPSETSAQCDSPNVPDSPSLRHTNSSTTSLPSMGAQRLGDPHLLSLNSSFLTNACVELLQVIPDLIPACLIELWSEVSKELVTDELRRKGRLMFIVKYIFFRVLGRAVMWPEYYNLLPETYISQTLRQNILFVVQRSLYAAVTNVMGASPLEKTSSSTIDYRIKNLVEKIISLFDERRSPTPYPLLAQTTPYPPPNIHPQTPPTLLISPHDLQTVFYFLCPQAKPSDTLSGTRRERKFVNTVDRNVRQEKRSSLVTLNAVSEGFGGVMPVRSMSLSGSSGHPHPPAGMSYGNEILHHSGSSSFGSIIPQVPLFPTSQEIYLKKSRTTDISRLSSSASSSSTQESFMSKSSMASSPQMPGVGVSSIGGDKDISSFGSRFEMGGGSESLSSIPDESTIYQDEFDFSMHPLFSKMAKVMEELRRHTSSSNNGGNGVAQKGGNNPLSEPWSLLYISFDGRTVLLSEPSPTTSTATTRRRPFSVNEALGTPVESGVSLDEDNGDDEKDGDDDNDEEDEVGMVFSSAKSRGISGTFGATASERRPRTVELSDNEKAVGRALFKILKDASSRWLAAFAGGDGGWSSSKFPKNASGIAGLRHKQMSREPTLPEIFHLAISTSRNKNDHAAALSYHSALSILEELRRNSDEGQYGQTGEEPNDADENMRSAAFDALLLRRLSFPLLRRSAQRTQRAKEREFWHVYVHAWHHRLTQALIVRKKALEDLRVRMFYVSSRNTKGWDRVKSTLVYLGGEGIVGLTEDTEDARGRDAKRRANERAEGTGTIDRRPRRASTGIQIGVMRSGNRSSEDLTGLVKSVPPSPSTDRPVADRKSGGFRSHGSSNSLVGLNPSVSTSGSSTWQSPAPSTPTTSVHLGPVYRTPIKDPSSPTASRPPPFPISPSQAHAQKIASQQQPPLSPQQSFTSHSNSSKTSVYSEDSSSNSRKLSAAALETLRTHLSSKNLHNFLPGEEAFHYFLMEVENFRDALVAAVWTDSLFLREARAFGKAPITMAQSIPEGVSTPTRSTADGGTMRRSTDFYSSYGSGGVNTYSPASPSPVNERKGQHRRQGSASSLFGAAAPVFSSSAPGPDTIFNQSAAIGANSLPFSAYGISSNEKNATIASTSVSSPFSFPSLMTAALSASMNSSSSQIDDFMLSLQLTLTGLIISEFGAGILLEKSGETDEWFNEFINLRGIDMATEAQMFYETRGGVKLDPVWQDDYFGSFSIGNRKSTPSRRGSRGTLGTIDTIGSADDRQKAFEEVFDNYDEGGYPLLSTYTDLSRQFALHSSPHQKLHALFAFELLVVASLTYGIIPQLGEWNSSPSTVSTSAPFPSSLSMHERAESIRSRPRSPSSGSLDSNGSNTPGTDAIVNEIERLLGSPLIRPRNFLRDLQMIASLIPGTILDLRDEGKAFWDMALAVMALKSECVGRIVKEGIRCIEGGVERRDNNKARHLSRQSSKSSGSFLEDEDQDSQMEAVRLFMIGAKESNVIAQRELATLYLSMPSINTVFPPVSLPKPPSNFQLPSQTETRPTSNPTKFNPMNVAAAMHWFALAAAQGDSTSQKLLSQKDGGGIGAMLGVGGYK